jgi:hypothetical protein
MRGLFKIVFAKLGWTTIFLLSISSAPACRDDGKGEGPGTGATEVTGEIGEHGLEIGSAVQLLSTTRGELAEQALRRLLPHGRAVLPYVEASLHTARAVGRKNLIVALRRLGLAESVPLLGHIAAYDEDLVAAGEALRTLELWSSERRPRGAAARQVLRKVDEVRGFGTLLLDP